MSQSRYFPTRCYSIPSGRGIPSALEMKISTRKREDPRWDIPASVLHSAGNPISIIQTPTRDIPRASLTYRLLGGLRGKLYGDFTKGAPCTDHASRRTPVDAGRGYRRMGFSSLSQQPRAARSPSVLADWALASEHLMRRPLSIPRRRAIGCSRRSSRRTGVTSVGFRYSTSISTNHSGNRSPSPAALPSSSS